MLNNFNRQEKKARAESKKFSVTDIHLPPKKNLKELSLKAFGVRHYENQQEKFLALGWRFIFGFFLFIFVISGLSPLAVWRRAIGAFEKSDQVRLYAESCQNENSNIWRGNLASLGEISVAPAANTADFSGENSAVYVGIRASLICGGFDLKKEIGDEGKEGERVEGEENKEETEGEEKIENGKGEGGENFSEGEIVGPESSDDVRVEDSGTENDDTTNPEPVEIKDEVETDDLRSENDDSPEESEGDISFFERVRGYFSLGIARAQELVAGQVAKMADLGQFQEARIGISFAAFLNEEDGDKGEGAGSDNSSDVETVEKGSVDAESSNEIDEKSEIGGGKKDVNDLESVIDDEADAPKPEVDDQNSTGADASETEKFLRSFFSRTAQAQTNNEARVIVWYSLPGLVADDGGSLWQELSVIGPENISNYTNDGYFYYEAPFLNSWEDVKDLQIKFEGLVDGESSFTFYLDSVWVEADYVGEDNLEKVERRQRWEEALQLLSDQTIIDIGTDGEFKFRYKKNERKIFPGLADIFGGKSFWSDVIVKVRLENSKGEVLDADLSMIFEENGEFTIKLPDSAHEFGPGKYKFIFSIEDDSGDEPEVLRLEKEFEWGVLAMNTNKKLYKSGEKAYLQMGVLDDNGRTICDAELNLRITDPNGTEFSLSTQSGDISRNPECGPDNVIDAPDYHAYFQLTEIGVYTIELEATTENGVKNISESIEVRDDLPFDLERIGPTRIYPRANYEMSLRVKIGADYKGDLSDFCPAGFDIIDQRVEIWDEMTGYFLDYQEEGFYFENLEEGDKRRLIWHGLELAPGDILQIYYTFDAPNVSPEFYLLGPMDFSDSTETLFREAGQWQIASDANVFRVTEYYLTTGQFTGTTYDLTLNQNLANDYFVMVRGSRIGSGSSNPDNDYARVYRVPGGRGDLPSSGASNIISLSRHFNTYNWEGVVTVVESLADQGNSGFRLLDIAETSLVGTATSGLDEISTAWTDINQVVPFGGYHAGGAEFEVNANTNLDGDVVYTRLWPTGTSTINWRRVDNGNGALLSATISTFVVEWGSDWNVQHAIVSGTRAGNGANALMEYSTSTISSVVRDNTWVWGTGVSTGDGIGEDAEGSLVTLGDGINQNVNETLVAVGAEYAFQRDFDVYAMTHSDLAVDYRFKVDGDSTLTDLAVTVDSAALGQRMSLVYNGCNGAGTAHPRDRFWSRYTSDTAITISRGYSGQAFPAWVQGVSFANVAYDPPTPQTNQIHFRWRDDSADLNTSSGWLGIEDENTLFSTAKNNPYRLRIAVANEDMGAEVAGRNYEIQWGEKNISCSNITTWTGIGDGNDAFAMFDSAYISPDGQVVSDPLLSNMENYSFVAGRGQDINDTTSVFSPLASTTYTELEYSIMATDLAIPGATYCFRLFDKASTTLDSYPVYPELTIRSTNISQVAIEWGVQSGVSDDSWTTLNFNGDYADPVFLSSFQYTNNIGNEIDGDADSVVTRVRNVDNSSAEVKLQRAGDLSGTLTRSEDVFWLVAEAGVYNNDEIKMEAYSYLSTITDRKSSWIGSLQTPKQVYTAPVVLGQVMTNNDENWSVFWARGSAMADPPSASSIYTGKNVAEDSLTVRANETLGVVILEQNVGLLNNISYRAVASTGKTIDRIDDNLNNYYTFSTPFTDIPTVAIIAQAGINGGDGPHPALYGGGALSTSTLRLTIMEDEIVDTEMTGSAEDVHYLVFENAGSYYSEDQSLDQVSYRLFSNANSVQPGSALSAEENSLSGVKIDDVVRLRIGLQPGLSDLGTSTKSFKLQYGQGGNCESIESWVDLGSSTENTAWRGYNNLTPIDGADMVSSLLDGGVNILQSYEEENRSILNPRAVARGLVGEWDWVIENHNAVRGATYCFRTVLGNGTAIDYSHYPKITTAAVKVSGRVFSDEGVSALLSSPIVSLAVNDSFLSSTTASAVDGSFSFDNMVQPEAGSAITLYLDNSPEKGVTIDRYIGTGDVLDLNIYQNRVLLRHDDDGPITEDDLDKFDNNQDDDIKFSSKPLRITDSHELYISAGSNLVLDSGDVSFSNVDINGALTASGGQIIYVSGNWDATDGSFFAASSTVEFSSADLGHSIISAGSSFYGLSFDGGGAWTNFDAATSTSLVSIKSGTLTQGNDLNITGLNISAGASFSKNEGYSLDILGGQISDANNTKIDLGMVSIRSVNATTSLVSDIFVSGLYIEPGSILATAGYDLSVGGDILIDGTLNCEDSGEGDASVVSLGENWSLDHEGVFFPANSVVVFTGASSSLINSGGIDQSHSFYDISFQKTGNATTTIIVYDLSVLHDLNIGADSIFDISASNFNLELGGSFVNEGIFNARSGTVRFNSDDINNIVSVGSSPFNHVLFDSMTGGWTIVSDLKTTGNFQLLNALSFVATSTVVLEIGGGFSNEVGGSATDWRQSTLYLKNYNGLLNSKNIGADNYYILKVGNESHLQMWNSSAAVYQFETAWFNPDWQYRKKITINSALISADHSDFIVVSTTTDPDLATVANGGYMALSGGEDIRLTDSDGLTALDFTRVSYNPNNGQLVLRIRTDVSMNTDKDIYIYYGNAAASDASVVLSASPSGEINNLFNLSLQEEYDTQSNSYGSLYSMDHGGVDGSLHIWGRYTKSSGWDYWSYEKDFDGTDLGMAARPADVKIDGVALVLYQGGGLEIKGTSSDFTVIDHQDFGAYTLKFADANLDANRYRIRNIDRNGLQILGVSNISSLDNGDFWLDILDGQMLSVSPETVNQNSPKIVSDCVFDGVDNIGSGHNISLLGESLGYINFRNYSGRYAGEDYDNDPGSGCGGLRWGDGTCSRLSQVHYRFRSDNNTEASATWKAAEDVDIDHQRNQENLRIRFSIDNIGDEGVDGTNYTLQFAHLGNNIDCYAVPSSEFSSVSTDGTGPVTMKISNYFTNTTPTLNRLTAEGSFTSGYMVESPQNYTTGINLPIGAFTEIEYNVEFTYESLYNESYCFRLSDGGADLSSYSKMPKVRMGGFIVNGVVYENHSTTPWGHCDGATQNISLVVNGDLHGTTFCNPSTGVYSFSGIRLLAGDSISIFMNDAGGNLDRGTVISKAANTFSNISANLYKSELWIRPESGTGNITNSDLSYCDADTGVACAAVPFNVVNGDLSVLYPVGLVVSDNVSFVPGGAVSIASGSSAELPGGDLSIRPGAVLDMEAYSLSVGGSWVNAGTFSSDSGQTVSFTATSTGHVISVGNSDFSNLTFSGIGGGWNFTHNTNINGSLHIDNGVISGASDVLVNGGSVVGEGVIAMTNGTFTVDGAGDFGGAADWTFHNLEFGDGVWTRTSSKVGNNTITVNGVLSVNTDQTLDAGSGNWILSGVGNSFVVAGIFNPQNSTVHFLIPSAISIPNVPFYNLEVSAAGATAPTATLSAGNLTISGNFQIGDGFSVVNVAANLTNPSINIQGDINIATSAAFVAPGTEMSIGGSWINHGEFTHNNGHVVFNSTQIDNIILASSSPFYSLDIDNSSGSWSIGDDLRVVNNFHLKNASSFQVIGGAEIEVGGVFTNSVPGASTDWGNSTLFLTGSSYTVNAKEVAGDIYYNIKTDSTSNIKLWNSSAVHYDTSLGGSIYSMDHAGHDGDLYIWGDYQKQGGAEYWSYDFDFDGTELTGAERACHVYLANNAVAEILDGTLYLLGEVGHQTEVSRQDSGSYDLIINHSAVNARHYQIAGTGLNGLQILNSSTIVSLDYGNFILSNDGSSMISIDGATINANPLSTISNCDFSLGGGVLNGTNIHLLGVSNSAWIVRDASGVLSGENYDNDPGDPRGYIIWEDSPNFNIESRNWRWYYDIASETPSLAVTGENISPSDVAPNSSLKLRVTLGEKDGLAAENVKVGLQFSTYADFSRDVYFVGDISSSTADWVYADGIDVDGDLVLTRVLSDSILGGTHNESMSSSGNFSFNGNEAREWEFTIRARDAEINNTYYFRPYVRFFSVYDDFEYPVSIASGSEYPGLSVSSGAISYSASGAGVGMNTEGVVSTINTSATNVSFGELLPSQEEVGIHSFTVNTNAGNGYQLFVQQTQNLMSENGADIDPVPSSNANPSAWPTDVPAGFFGYHTGDDTLSGSAPSRFAADNTYARFEDTPQEISYSPTPVSNEEIDLIYRVDVSDQQEAGDYTTSIIYILVPTF